MDNKLVVFSYVVLLSVTSYCLTVYAPTIQKFTLDELYQNFALVTYSIFLCSSMTGIVVYGVHPIFFRCFVKIYSFLILAHAMISYPCFVTTLWTRHQLISNAAAIAHALYGVFLSILYLLGKKFYLEYLDNITNCCNFSMLIIFIETSDFDVLVSLVTCGVSYFVLRERLYIHVLNAEVTYNLVAVCSIISVTKCLTNGFVVDDIKRRKSYVDHRSYGGNQVCPETNFRELLEQLHNVSMVLELTFGYPCYVAKTWMHHKFLSEKVALSLMGYGAVTTLFYLNGSPITLLLVDGSVNISTFSLVLLSIEKNDLLVEVALGFVMMGYYLLRSQVHLLGYLDPVAVYYFCQTAFVFLTLKLL